jgi:hypothetical protein
MLHRMSSSASGSRSSSGRQALPSCGTRQPRAGGPMARWRSCWSSTACRATSRLGPTTTAGRTARSGCGLPAPAAGARNAVHRLAQPWRRSGQLPAGWPGPRRGRRPGTAVLALTSRPIGRPWHDTTDLGRRANAAVLAQPGTRAGRSPCAVALSADVIRTYEAVPSRSPLSATGCGLPRQDSSADHGA